MRPRLYTSNHCNINVMSCYPNAKTKTIRIESWPVVSDAAFEPIVQECATIFSIHVPLVLQGSYCVSESASIVTPDYILYGMYFKLTSTFLSNTFDSLRILTEKIVYHDSLCIVQNYFVRCKSSPGVTFVLLITYVS